MIFRIANKNDFDTVHDLMNQIFEKHLTRRPDVYKPGDPFPLEQFLSCLNNPDDIMILAESENQIVGVCHMVKKVIREHPILHSKCIAYIEDFCVDKDSQRKGFGRALYQEAIKRAMIWQAHTLELNVWEINPEARKFYDAAGFQPKSTHMELKLK